MVPRDSQITAASQSASQPVNQSASNMSFPIVPTTKFVSLVDKLKVIELEESRRNVDSFKKRKPHAKQIDSDVDSDEHDDALEAQCADSDIFGEFANEIDHTDDAMSTDISSEASFQHARGSFRGVPGISRFNSSSPIGISKRKRPPSSMSTKSEPTIGSNALVVQEPAGYALDSFSSMQFTVTRGPWMKLKPVKWRR